jgi:hypothetical protein
MYSSIRPDESSIIIMYHPELTPQSHEMIQYDSFVGSRLFKISLETFIEGCYNIGELLDTILLSSSLKAPNPIVGILCGYIMARENGGRLL